MIFTVERLLRSRPARFTPRSLGPRTRMSRARYRNAILSRGVLVAHASRTHRECQRMSSRVAQRSKDGKNQIGGPVDRDAITEYVETHSPIGLPSGNRILRK